MKHARLNSKSRTFFNILSVLLILTVVTASLPTGVAAQSPVQQSKPSPASNQIADAQCYSNPGSISRSNSGLVGFVGSSPTKPIKQPMADLKNASPEAAARGYLSKCGSIFGLSDQASELSLMRSKPTGDGRTVVRFQQKFQGVPVIGGEILVQITEANDILMVNSSLMPRAKLNTTPSLDSAVARQAALQLVADKYGMSIDTLSATEPELWVYSPALLTQKGRTQMVWKFNVTPVDLAPVREMVLINAHDGSTALSFNQTDTAKHRLVYDVNNTTTLPGSLICNETTDATCAAAGADADAHNAFDFAGDTYDFYFANHARDSIDNAGMNLISSVHYSSGYCNAFWNGSQMTYGDGCTIVVDDVVAHELTHGVTEYESGLIYIGQSGAINESFSDIWGEWVDQENGAGTDTAGVRWQMGEDTSIGAIRNMKDPTIFGDPDRMQSLLYVEGADVHINSGVGNKAAYLITDGDTFNGYTVTGIGYAKAAKIYYEAQTNILTAASNYLALRNALNQACTTLTGTSGITSGDCTEVNEATLATDMDFFFPVPANDAFGTPTVISALPYTNTQDIRGANPAVNDPVISCAGFEGGYSVWYQYTANFTGNLTLSTNGSDYDTILGVWTGATPGTLSSVGCNDDISYPSNLASSLTIPVVSGTTYRIEVAGYDAGTLVLNVGEIILSPKGTIDDTTPTYRWTKVAGASQYRFEVYRGATLVYAYTVPNSNCVGSICAKTASTTALDLFKQYKWRIRAKVGGVWQPFSGYQNFMVVAPFTSNFTINAKGWSTLNGSWVLSGGTYKGSGVFNQLASIGHLGDYSNPVYQVMMKRTGTCIGCANAIYVRGVPGSLTGGWWDTGFYFAVSNDGWMNLYYAEGGSYYTILPWTFNPNISGNWNTIKVVTTPDVLKFYVNNALVITLSGVSGVTNPTGQVGIGHYDVEASVGDPTDKLFVDWAKVNYVGTPFKSDDYSKVIQFSRDMLVNPMSAPDTVAP